MKYATKFLMMGALALSLAACDDKDNGTEGGADISIEVNAENLKNWTSYADQVAKLLQKDASDLLSAWETSYKNGEPFAKTFKEHKVTYTSAENCIEQIIDGCAEIANEVGEAKMGDPLSLYLDGKTEEALYAVESWFSWHSRDDYSNNILSIRNCYYGSLDGNVAQASISKLVASINPSLDNDIKAAIADAYVDILAIPQPFRNNINSTETNTAIESCAILEQLLSKQLKPIFENIQGHDAEMDAIVTNYVDNVVLPTYRSLASKADALYKAVHAMHQNPTDQTFEAAANAWLEARTPWEQSEGFLFGPVDELGLDPNMDSWPLDQTAISNHIGNGDFSDLESTDNDGLVTEAAQSIRGFHTLEFLIFKDGAARKVDDLK